MTLTVNHIVVLAQALRVVLERTPSAGEIVGALVGAGVFTNAEADAELEALVAEVLAAKAGHVTPTPASGDRLNAVVQALADHAVNNREAV